MAINTHREFLKKLRKNPEYFYIIHYSCQSLNDDNEGLSPRITSIAISHYSTEQSVSFSTHAIAEELGIARKDVHQKFDEIEKELLSQFFKFVRERRANFWIHWNMRNATYGFEHLEHRYKVLGGQDASVIPVEQRVNLNDMLSMRYGNDYAPHQKLPNLMDMNGGKPKHFLSGLEEVEAFSNSDFMQMHMSTQAKVSFMQAVVRKLLSGKLKTASKGFGVRLDRLFDSRFVKFLGLIGLLISLGLAIYQIVEIVQKYGVQPALTSSAS